MQLSSPSRGAAFSKSLLIDVLLLLAFVLLLLSLDVRLGEIVCASTLSVCVAVLETLSVLPEPDSLSEFDVEGEEKSVAAVEDIIAGRVIVGEP